MDNNRLLILLNKYQSNACTELELHELEQWYSTLNTGNQLIDTTDAFANEMLLQFRQRLSEQTATIPFYRKRLFRIAAAASILLIIALGVVFVIGNRDKDNVTANRDAGSGKQTDVKAPETNRAMITLANGQKVYLDSADNGTLATQGNINVIKTADGKIVYDAVTLSRVEGPTAVAFNTLTNPRGSKVIDMTLADGSRVWLNAGSSVTYPVAFVGKERKVNITGEAYFEVAHNARKPFYVSKGDVSVQVLGTHFNVNAYDDEAEIKVTLLEGSVKVSKGTGSTLIKPGEQASISHPSQKSTKIPVQTVDVEQVMAWKNGLFYFDKADIKTIMKEVSRWYDVEVIYSTEVKELFRLKTSRNTSVSNIFKILEEIGGVHLEVDGKKIIVKK